MVHKLLLVEEDAEIARIVKDTLTHEGYDVPWLKTQTSPSKKQLIMQKQ